MLINDGDDQTLKLPRALYHHIERYSHLKILEQLNFSHAEETHKQST